MPQRKQNKVTRQHCVFYKGTPSAFQTHGKNADKNYSSLNVVDKALLQHENFENSA